MEAIESRLVERKVKKVEPMDPSFKLELAAGVDGRSSLSLCALRLRRGRRRVDGWRCFVVGKEKNPKGQSGICVSGDWRS